MRRVFLYGLVGQLYIDKVDVDWWVYLIWWVAITFIYLGIYQYNRDQELTKQVSDTLNEISDSK